MQARTADFGTNRLPQEGDCRLRSGSTRSRISRFAVIRGRFEFVGVPRLPEGFPRIHSPTNWAAVEYLQGGSPADAEPPPMANGKGAAKAVGYRLGQNGRRERWHRRTRVAA